MVTKISMTRSRQFSHGLLTYLFLLVVFCLAGCTSHATPTQTTYNDPKDQQARIRFVSYSMTTLYQVPYGQCEKRVAIASLSNMFSPRTHKSSSKGMPWRNDTVAPKKAFRYKEVVVEGDEPIHFLFSMKQNGKRCTVNSGFTPRIGADYDALLHCDLAGGTKIEPMYSGYLGANVDFHKPRMPCNK